MNLFKLSILDGTRYTKQKGKSFYKNMMTWTEGRALRSVLDITIKSKYSYKDSSSFKSGRKKYSFDDGVFHDKTRILKINR